ncbi:MAG: serine hydrolase, partial [Balneolaceae bacterium]
SVYFYEHTGLLPGYQSWADYSDESDAIVVQFVNTSGGYSWEKAAIIKNRIIKIIERTDI